ncbi:MAG TPA: alpha/beta fold hydrolase [Pyrinomonadaceae bacterium]|nr:alpha/beta fold hydrolase [Pyrinomonadaceae bacterium]
MTHTSRNPWLVRWQKDEVVRLRLFCFPYAGGSAWSFCSWQQDLPAGVEVCGIELPGRATRQSETPYARLSTLNEAMTEALLPCLDKPFALFGHSMGALIAFEFARYLRRKHRLVPRHLFVSGRRTPQIPYRERRTYDLSDEDFIQDLLLDGPAEYALDPQLVRLLLPMMRADFEVVQTYVYEPGLPLLCPITVFGGLQDHSVSSEELHEWRHQTTGSYSVVMLPGDHFFIKTAQRELLRAMSQELDQLVKSI